MAERPTLVSWKMRKSLEFILYRRPIVGVAFCHLSSFILPFPLHSNDNKNTVDSIKLWHVLDDSAWRQTSSHSNGRSMTCHWWKNCQTKETNACLKCPAAMETVLHYSMPWNVGTAILLLSKIHSTFSLMPKKRGLKERNKDNQGNNCKWTDYDAHIHRSIPLL